jgi:ABC-type cobalamin/Fe3+-siderophores transport system ATPase subunit
MLEVSNISVTYGQHHALSDAALHVERGEIIVILGANGAGKSSLLKAIAGLLPSPAKIVKLAGRDLSRLPPHEIVEAGLALVPEGRGVFGELTVAENLLLGANPKACAGGRGRAACQGDDAVSSARRTPGADGAHHERRRAADGGNRPRADVEPGHSSARRAVARSVATCWCANCSPPCARCARPASGCCWSSRTRARVWLSPIAAI